MWMLERDIMEGKKMTLCKWLLISSGTFLIDLYAYNLTRKFIQKTERKSESCIPRKTLLSILRSDGVFSPQKMRAAARHWSTCGSRPGQHCSRVCNPSSSWLCSKGICYLAFFPQAYLYTSLFIMDYKRLIKLCILSTQATPLESPALVFLSLFLYIKVFKQFLVTVKSY